MSKIDKQVFREAVYAVVKVIPKGRATSYGVIARIAGYPNHSRMVGRLMSECNAKMDEIPAHRVVNSQGQLSGRKAFGANNEMQLYLEAEGISIVNNRIQNWKYVFWNPLVHLDNSHL